MSFITPLSLGAKPATPRGQMSDRYNFKVESYETYYGDIDQVKKTMNECRVCGSKLIHSHVSDYRNFYVQEASQCTQCGAKVQKKMHVLS